MPLPVFKEGGNWVRKTYLQILGVEVSDREDKLFGEFCVTEYYSSVGRLVCVSRESVMSHEQQPFYPIYPTSFTYICTLVI